LPPQYLHGRIGMTDRMAGTIGRAGAYSFYATKTITTAEGGMLVTDDEQIYERVWSLKDHGKARAAREDSGDGVSFRWLHESFGTNWRMTEMQSAIGRVALKRLPLNLAARRANAGILNEQLAGLAGLEIPLSPSWGRHAYYKYYAFVRPESLASRWNRDRIASAICAEGIPCGSGACPEIYLERAFEGCRGRPVGRLPIAKRLGERSLMLLVHPTMGPAEMEHTAQAVRKVFEAATA
jgi:hypothetical protein